MCGSFCSITRMNDYICEQTAGKKQTSFLSANHTGFLNLHNYVALDCLQQCCEQTADKKHSNSTLTKTSLAHEFCMHLIVCALKLLVYAEASSCKTCCFSW